LKKNQIKNINYPISKHAGIREYFMGYIDAYLEGMRQLDMDCLLKSFELITSTIKKDSTIFFCGNGGSAAISNHMECDHIKGIKTNTHLHPMVRSLSSNVPIITAIANDIGYENVYSYQLGSLAKNGDLLITVSSSGNSKNIILALEKALEMGVNTIALSGFDGGLSRVLSTINLHLPIYNYGIVEDGHQSILHVLAQYIRQSNEKDLGVGRDKYY